MVKKKSNKKKDFIVIKVSLENGSKMVEYDSSIRKYLSENNPVVFKEYNDLINLIYSGNNKDRKNYKDLRQRIKMEVTDFTRRLNMDFDFSFEKKYKSISDISNARGTFDTHKGILKTSFEQMLTIVVVNCVKDIENRLDFARRCYSIIDIYTKKDKRIRKMYSHSKIAVLTAYIAFKLDTFKLSAALQECKDNKTEPTTMELYEWMDDTFDKVRTYSSKK